MVRRLFDWVRSWWVTWQVLRHADAEQRFLLTHEGPFDPDMFVEVDRP